MLLNEKTINDLKKSSGYGYGWNIRKVAEFESIFGFNPCKYPQYFEITSGGYVSKTQLFIDHCRAIFNNSRQLVGMLTEQTH